MQPKTVIKLVATLNRLSPSALPSRVRRQRGEKFGEQKTRTGISRCFFFYILFRTPPSRRIAKEPMVPGRRKLDRGWGHGAPPRNNSNCEVFILPTSGADLNSRENMAGAIRGTGAYIIIKAAHRTDRAEFARLIREIKVVPSSLHCRKN